MIIIESSRIGIGKTTLANILGDTFNFPVYNEEMDWDKLNWFYRDIAKGIKPSDRAFDLQMSLMDLRADRYIHARDEEEEKGIQTIHDRSLIGDRGFAHKLWRDGFISDRCYEDYIYRWNILQRDFSIPDLVIKLNAGPMICIERIRQRMGKNENRRSEASITENYLNGLEDSYEKVVWPWFRERCHIFEYEWDDFSNLDKLLHEVSILLNGSKL